MEFICDAHRIIWYIMRYYALVFSFLFDKILMLDNGNMVSDEFFVYLCLTYIYIGLQVFYLPTPTNILI